jgi:hypothetical protein
MEILIAFLVFMIGLMTESMRSTRNERRRDEELFEYRLARYAGSQR